VAKPPASNTEQRMLWSFWLACALAVAAGVAPFVFGGGSSRLGGAVFPFALGAILLGACALLYSRGKPLTALLYFLASLSIVYGVLAILALPLRLAVIGTCLPAPAACAPGLERPLTSGESTALGFAIGIGIVAILTGFFGLVTLYRRQAATYLPPVPPVRQIAPVGTKKSTESSAAAPAAEPAAAATSQPAAAPAPEPEPESELPAHPPDLELAAPVEPLELPEVGTADRVEVAPPAPPKPRRKRVPKATPATTPPTPDTDASA
jgi:hypothetical protein